MIRKTLIVVAAGAAAWFATAGAMAATSDVLPSVRVSYADLDMSKAASVEIMRHRLRQASDTVCGGDVDNRDLRAYAAHEQCTARAMSAALDQVHAAHRAAHVAAHSAAELAANSR
jgi:UrcA family protein